MADFPRSRSCHLPLALLLAAASEENRREAADLAREIAALAIGRDCQAARDPANAEWQRDLIVSNGKLSEVTGDKSFVRRALETAEGMKQRNILAPRDAWMIEDLRNRAGQ